MARKGWSAASRSSVLATKNIGFCTFRSPRIVVPSSELRRRIINETLYLASIKAGVFQQPARGWGTFDVESCCVRGKTCTHKATRYGVAFLHTVGKTGRASANFGRLAACRRLPASDRTPERYLQFFGHV